MKKIKVPQRLLRIKHRSSADQKMNSKIREEPRKEDDLPQLGIRFPWIAIIFVTMGLASEIVDAMFMNATLETLSGELSPTVAAIISYIVGAGCFLSMAFVGFTQSNKKYYSKTGEVISYIFWGAAGLALVAAKFLAGLMGGGLQEVLEGRKALGEVLGTEEFISNLVIAIVQFVLYIGTGFMTRDSVKILTDSNLREYWYIRRRCKHNLRELADQHGEIMEDITKLKIYPKVAKRLLQSRKAVLKNVAQYNEAARAIIEAKMALKASPDLMDEMYDRAMSKEKDRKRK